jgi:hypothetical protein
VRVPIDDTDAWSWYPQHRWIYDRLAVALSQGLTAGPHGADPGAFPVFSKPIVNLKGMGLGSRTISTRAAYEASYEPGHMWMPKLAGAHISTDCAVLDGAIVWSRHAQGTTAPGGRFRWWKVWRRRDEALMSYLSEWSARHLKGYVGMANFETIGGKIIEAHLRFADQWTDLYGKGWVEAMVRLYAKREWRFDDSEPREGFSIPLFTSDQGKVRRPSAALIEEVKAMPSISSVQITFHPGKPLSDHASPPGGKRLALVNAWRLKEGRAALARLAQGFPDQTLI